MKKLKSFLNLFFLGQNYFGYSPNVKGTIKFSALITGIKGLVGGTVFSSVKSGAVLQNNVQAGQRQKGPGIVGVSHGAYGHSQGWQFNKRLASPGFLNPDGSQQPNPKNLASKQNLRTVSKAWAQLSDDDRATWYWVATNGPSKNRFGDKYTPSAYQAFMQYNLNLLTVGVSARQIPSCTIVKIIDEEAQEEMTCMVCDNNVVWCVYSNDLSDDKDEDARIRMQTKCNGNPDAFMLIYSSRPMSPGRSKANTLQLIAIIKPIAGYNNFLLRPSFNAVFGKNIGGSNFQYKTVSMSPGGAQTIVSSGIFSLPKTTDLNKIAYTLDAENFIWEGDGSTLVFGNVIVDAPAVLKTILPYGIELPVSTAYTIIGTLPLGSPFSFAYGSVSAPIDTSTLKTDIYGNIPPIPLIISFAPTAPGVHTGIITIACASFSIDINLNGIGV